MSSARAEHVVHVGVGSNLDRHENVSACLTELMAAFGDLVTSSVYESDAVGHDGPAYYNLAVRFVTVMSAGEIASRLHRIEDVQGRTRGEDRFADRTLDIDVLLYDDLCGEVEGLVLPRPEIVQYVHVLLPLAEIAGHVIFPGTERTIAELCRDLGTGDRRIRRVPFAWHHRPLPAHLEGSPP